MDDFSEKVIKIVRTSFDIGQIFTDREVIEFVRTEFDVDTVFPAAIEPLQEQIEELEQQLVDAMATIAVLEAKLDGGM